MFSYYEMRNYELDVVHNRRAVDYGEHMHDDLELIYMIDGEQRIRIGKAEYLLKKGDCAAVFPNMTHAYLRPETVQKKNNAADYLMIFIPSKMLYGMYPDMHGTQLQSSVLSADEVHEDAVLGFNKISEASALNTRIAWAQLILSYVIPKFAVNKLSAGNNPEIVSMIMRYVSENYLKSLTLDSLEEILGISKYKISRIFSDKVHMSFRDYIGMLRANHAAQLINMQDEPMPKIAEKSGFESTRSFYRVFREVYGISPASYKNMVRKTEKGARSK